MKREPRTRAQREPGILALQAEEEVNTSSQRGRGSAGPRGWPNRSYPRQDCQISRVPPLTLVSNLGSPSQWSVAMPALTHVRVSRLCTGFVEFDRGSSSDHAPPRIVMPARDDARDDHPTASHRLIASEYGTGNGNQDTTTAAKEVIAMSRDHRSVYIRAGPATPADRSEINQNPMRRRPELVAAVERAAVTPEAPPGRASVPSGIETQERIIPNGWFG